MNLPPYNIHRARLPLAFTLPEGYTDGRYSGMPLYMIVAFWALHQSRPVTVKDVRINFGISIRRASDLLEYISEKGNKYISAECFLTLPPGGGRIKRRAWLVSNIKGEAGMYKIINNKAVNDNTLSNSSEDIFNVRKWMISRKVGERMPEIFFS
ncbi:TPA: CaiF/GrlA family transcriptional regulator [Klebsiella quasipneumoniae subsp. quasipneumoniae]|nr:CaiF/GrlA family transcriptional regulator [Klebsiella quasipneumoniae subsp. quasipneumoniae]